MTGPHPDGIRQIDHSLQRNIAEATLHLGDIGLMTSGVGCYVLLRQLGLLARLPKIDPEQDPQLGGCAVGSRRRPRPACSGIVSQTVKW